MTRDAPRRKRRFVACCLASLLCAPASATRAQSSCALTARDSIAHAAARHWPSPLDRVVAARGWDLSLRDALDRLAATARVRLSYSAELLPLDRRVCVSHDSVAVGDALAELLRGVSVEPVVAGSDQIVLTPVRARDGPEHEPRAQRNVDLLDRVVVTGSVNGGSERQVPVALDVVSGRQLAQRDASTFAEILDGAAPGMWVWEQSPASLLARYGSIRGASSFGVSYPKLYIDGIEVANPLLVTRLDPETIERVEIMRGPQGAALYGADAISGVINVVMRHDGGVDAGGQRGRVRTVAGVAASDFASHGILEQEHSVTVRGGSSTRSAGLSVGVSTVGEFIPGAYTRDVMANGSARLVGSRTTLTGTVRLFAEQAGAANSPLLAGLSPVRPNPDVRQTAGSSGARDPGDAPIIPISPVDTAAPQRVREYTLGTTGTFAANPQWTHTGVIGIDGYRLTNVAVERTPVASMTDSALRAARGGADRGTLRLSTVGRFGLNARVATTLTFAAEQSVLREQTAGSTVPTIGGRQVSGSSTSDVVDWRSNTGLVAQASSALGDLVFLSGGVRMERNDGFAAGNGVATLPMLGGALVQDRGDVTVKLRAAYGKGIRPPQTVTRVTTWEGARTQVVTSSLAPEEQRGIEAGLDVLLGRVIAMHVTRFDQRASGLIQQVPVVRESESRSGPPPRDFSYVLQNVGEIDNRGWEMQSSADAGRLTLTGAFSTVDSRVRQLARGYSGDLRPGDRMLEVPARTMSLTAAWTEPARWGASVTVARATDWINYDRLALAQAFADSTRPPGDLVGPRLRSYWRTYGGVTRVRASASRGVGHGLTLVITGENLLNRQRGEPDNVTIVPGRTIVAGVRAGF